MNQPEIIIGLISDTHGQLRPQVIDNLKGCDAIIHAGDICNDEIITRLLKISPVYPVAGNMDRKGIYPASDIIQIGEYLIYIIHDIAAIDLDLEAAGIDIVIFGHSHQPTRFMRGKITFINPGSAGPERPRRPISMARMRLTQNQIITDFIEL
jgi:putative phosphoesterase